MGMSDRWWHRRIPLSPRESIKTSEGETATMEAFARGYRRPVEVQNTETLAGQTTCPGRKGYGRGQGFAVSVDVSRLSGACGMASVTNWLSPLSTKLSQGDSIGTRRSVRCCPKSNIKKLFWTRVASEHY